MMKPYDTDTSLVGLHSKAFADDQFTRMVTRYRQQQDKYLRPAHLVEFEEGDHSFSERALEKIAADVVKVGVDMASKADMTVYVRIADGYVEAKKPAAESMVGRLFKLGGQRSVYRCVDFDPVRQIITGHVEGGGIHLGLMDFVCHAGTWLPAHAVLIDHTRPLMWVPRDHIDFWLDQIAYYGVNYKEIEREAHIFMGRFGTSEVLRGCQLSDYLPEGV